MLSLLLIATLASISTATYVLSPPDIRYESTESIVASLSALNHHGAPLPPSSFGSTPGWYYGDAPGSADDLPWLKDAVSDIHCRGSLTLHISFLLAGLLRKSCTKHHWYSVSAYRRKAEEDIFQTFCCSSRPRGYTCLPVAISGCSL